MIPESLNKELADRLEESLSMRPRKVVAWTLEENQRV